MEPTYFRAVGALHYVLATALENEFLREHCYGAAVRPRRHGRSELLRAELELHEQHLRRFAELHGCVGELEVREQPDRLELLIPCDVAHVALWAPLPPRAELARVA